MSELFLQILLLSLGFSGLPLLEQDVPVAYGDTLEEQGWEEKNSLSFLTVGIDQVDYTTKNELVQASDEDIYWVVGILDGDTIFVADVDGRVFQVRLLAVDTEEINGPDSSAECYGYEATLFTTEFLMNRAVRLRADSANEDLDPYGRKLRYVDVLQEDGSFLSLNQALLTEGYASFPSEYSVTDPNMFSKLEQEAQDAKKGLWGACYE